MAPVFESVESINAGRDNWRLKVRVIRLWTVKYSDESEDISSIEMVLMDEGGCTIQATIRKGVIKKFANLIEEGIVYRISYLSVFKNHGLYKVTPHPFRTYFLFKTTVGRVDSRTIPLYGLKPLPFSDVLSKVDEEPSLIDVVGLLVGVSPEREWKKNGRCGSMFVLDLMDEHGKVECALFGSYMQQLREFLETCNAMEVVVVLQFVKLKMFQGKPVLSNVLQATRLMINPAIDEVGKFRKRVSDAGLLAAYPRVVVGVVGNVSLKEEFLTHFPKKKLTELQYLSEDGCFVVIADISSLNFDGGWFYPACKCNRAVVPDSGLYLCGQCDMHVLDVTPRFKLEVEVVDDDSSAIFVMFDREIEMLVGHTCRELLMSVDGVRSVRTGRFPSLLNEIIGRRVLFKVEIRVEDGDKQDGTYRVRKICVDDGLIAEFSMPIKGDAIISASNLEVSELTSGARGSADVLVGVNVSGHENHSDECVNLADDRVGGVAGIGEIVDHVRSLGKVKIEKKRVKNAK